MAANPKFTILHEKLRGKTFELDKDVMSIGRREGMDICIPDPSLSGHHADLIKSERNGKVVYTLRDNDSTNGTRVNNNPITEQDLKNSDLVMFGLVEVLFDGADNAPVNRTTHTLDISNIGNSQIQASGNFNPLAGKEAANEKMIQKATVIAGTLLGIAALAAAIFAIIRLF